MWGTMQSADRSSVFLQYGMQLVGHQNQPYTLFRLPINRHGKPEQRGHVILLCHRKPALASGNWGAGELQVDTGVNQHLEDSGGKQILPDRDRPLALISTLGTLRLFLPASGRADLAGI